MISAPALVALFLAGDVPLVDDSSVVAYIMVDRFRDGAANADDVAPAHPRRFQGGDLRGLRDALPYLRALGVSHVLITPLHRQARGLVGRGDDATAAYHGYWPEDFTAFDPHFGDADEVRALVAAAADVDIGVLLDVVVNHTGYGAADPRHLVREPCGDGDEQSCLFGLPDLRTEDPRVRQAVVSDVQWWMRLAPFAGVRLDAFKHIDREAAIAIRAAVHSERPGAVVVAEVWGAGPDHARIIDDVAAGATDTAFDFGLMGLARDALQGRLRGAALAHHLKTRARAPLAARMFTFLDNHDTETWAHATADRAPLGAAFVLATPGVPVLTWGTELSREGGPGDPTCRSFMPWERVPLAEADPQSPLRLWRALVALRRSSPALRHGGLEVRGAGGTTAPWIVWQRASPDDQERVLVAVAVGAGLVHCEPLGDGERVVDVVAWPGASLATVDGVTVTGTSTAGRVLCARAARDGLVITRVVAPRSEAQ